MAADTENLDAALPEAKQVESLLLSVAHHWSRRETHARQTELLERHFSQEQMVTALLKLHKLGDLQPAPKHRQGGGVKTATLAQAEDVLGAITSLGNLDKLPRFVVQSDDLPRVLPLLGALSIGDEQAVSVRLEALEATQRQHMMEMKRMLANARPAGIAMAGSMCVTPDITLTAPSFGTVGSRAQPQMTLGGLGPQETQGKTSYAAKAGASAAPKGGDAGLNPPQQDFTNRPTRAELGGRKTGGGGKVERSTSVKRRRLSREDENLEGFRTQGRTRKVKERPKVNTGSASVEEFADLAGPIEIWVGNTRPETDEDKVEQVLMLTASKIGITGFKVEKVVKLTKQDQPRTRSWKVVVPARLKEDMMKPEMYPPGWTFREFTAGYRRPDSSAEVSRGSSPAGAGVAEPV